MMVLRSKFYIAFKKKCSQEHRIKINDNLGLVEVL